MSLKGYKDIENCAQGKEGQHLLHLNGVKTNSLNPTLYFVPWIVYNGVIAA